MLRRASLEIEDKGRHRLEADFSVRLLGVDLAGEGLPAARLIKSEIVRLAKEKRELHGIVIAEGLDPRR